MTYTGNDFRVDTPPRIMGSETEYTTDCMPEDLNLISLLPEDLKAYRNHADDNGEHLWLHNGSRLYVDSGGLLEYATPEVNSARDLMIHERAGESIVSDVAQEVTTSSEEGYVHHSATGVYKRSGYDIVPRKDTQPLIPMSAGHHENYATPLAVKVTQDHFEPYARQALSAYLATRAVWSGAGMVTQEGYELSQKAQAINFYGTHLTSHGSKRPFDTHEDDAQLHRLEVRTGEGNMSEWVIIQKFALTSLVLRLIEHGEFPEGLFVRDRDATGVMRRTSKRMAIATRSKYMTAAMHQRYIAELGIKFAEKHPNVPQEEVTAAHEIIAACDQIDEVDEEFNGISLLSDRIDWAAKLDLMRMKGINHTTTDDPRAVQIDLQWENVMGKSIAKLWYEKFGRPTQLTPGALELARQQPPFTRALARTSFLASLQDHPTLIGWHRVETGSQLHYFRDLYDFSLHDQS